MNEKLCVCVCVCVRERGEGGGGRKKELHTSTLDTNACRPVTV